MKYNKLTGIYSKKGLFSKIANLIPLLTNINYKFPINEPTHRTLDNTSPHIIPDQVTGVALRFPISIKYSQHESRFGTDSFTTRTTTLVRLC